MSKIISIYGTKYVMQKHTYKQCYTKWCYHRMGDKAGQKWYKRKVLKKVTRKQRYKRLARFDISGRGKDIYKAIGKVVNKEKPLVPKERHVKVEARELIERPEEYAEVGEWTTVRPSIESP